MTDIKRIGLAGAIVLTLLLLLLWATSSDRSGGQSHDVALRSIKTDNASPPAVVAPSTPSSSTPGADSATSTRLYAVSLPRLAGLSSEAQPGTSLELWVAWEPPITKQPRIQRLATDVTLERVVPPVAPDGSSVALLRIPRKEIPSVLYGDRYGAMSAVVTDG